MLKEFQIPLVNIIKLNIIIYFILIILWISELLWDGVIWVKLWVTLTSFNVINPVQHEGGVQFYPILDQKVELTFFKQCCFLCDLENVYKSYKNIAETVINEYMRQTGWWWVWAVKPVSDPIVVVAHLSILSS